MMWTKSASIQNKWTKRHGKCKRQFKSFVNLTQEMKKKGKYKGLACKVQTECPT